jgi:REP element-mobilizing transposase RayT
VVREPFDYVPFFSLCFEFAKAAERRQSLARGETPGLYPPPPFKPWKGDSACHHPESRMPQSYACLHYHFIFSTKEREALITPELGQRLFEYIGGTLRPNKSVLLAAGGMPDHVHLLVGLSKELSVSEIMRIVKSESSKWIHETFRGFESFAWQSGYGAFTVSHSNLNGVEQYIAHQPEHRRVKSFKDEFVEFLARHEIQFDERYLWE